MHVLRFGLTALLSMQVLLCLSVSAESKSSHAPIVIYALCLRYFSPAGDINSATAQLPRLEQLGVTVIWLHPVTPTGKPVNGHPSIDSFYCVHNYYNIEPRYGTSSDLKKFVNTAHKLGMKVILDEVLNHTAWDNALISTHPEYYVHTDGDATNPKSVAQAFGWTDVAQLNYFYPNHDLWNYMDQMLGYWIKEYDIDGFRFDAADNPAGANRKIPAEFWLQLGEKLRQIKPHLFLLGECQSPELSGKPFDIDYTWDVYRSLKAAASGGSASRVVDTWMRMVAAYPQSALHMMIQDDFDEKRDVIAFQGVDGAKAAAVFDFTIGGIPLINNGMEIGNSRSYQPIDWKDATADLSAFYHDLIMLRADNAAFREGSLTWCANSTPDQVLTYIRQSGKSQFLVVINISPTSASGKILSDCPGDWKCVFPMTQYSQSAFDQEIGYSLHPKQFAIYRRDR